MKQKIIEKAKNEGILEVGFTELVYDPILESIYNKQKVLNYKTSFQVGEIEDKTFKSDKFKDYNSAIVVLISYPSGIDYIKSLDDNKCFLSTCSWGKDYHKVLSEKLEVLCESLIGYKYEIFVDNNILDERYLAYKAGLGYYGKNNLLINDKYGSYFFIGVILTNCIFEYDKPLTKKCNECNECMRKCPTKAINKNGILNGKKCLSYITQKKNISEEESKLLNSCVYGCDICSICCPHNKKILSSHNEFDMDENDIFNEDEFLNMKGHEFKTKYNYKSCYWRGVNIIKRNVEFNKLNKLK